MFGKNHEYGLSLKGGMNMDNNENRKNGLTIEELTKVTGGLGRRPYKWTCPNCEQTWYFPTLEEQEKKIEQHSKECYVSII